MDLRERNSYWMERWHWCIQRSSESKGYEGIEVDFRNLEFHDNEEVNYTVISRVFNEIFELQKSILNVIIEEEGAGVKTEVANKEDLY